MERIVPPWELEAEERDRQILAEHGPVAVIDAQIEDQRRALASARHPGLRAAIRENVNRLLDDRNLVGVEDPPQVGGLT